MKGAIIAIMFSFSLNTYLADLPENKLKEIQKYEFYGDQKVTQNGEIFNLSFRDDADDLKYPIDAVLFEKEVKKGKIGCVNFYYWENNILVGWILYNDTWIKVPEEYRLNIENMLKGIIDKINEGKSRRASL